MIPWAPAGGTATKRSATTVRQTPSRLFSMEPLRAVARRQRDGERLALSVGDGYDALDGGEDGRSAAFVSTEGLERADRLGVEGRRGLGRPCRGPRVRRCGAGPGSMLGRREQDARRRGLRVREVMDGVNGRLETEQADEKAEREDRRPPATSAGCSESEAGQAGREKTDPPGRAAEVHRMTGPIGRLCWRQGDADGQQRHEDQQAHTAALGRPDGTPPVPCSSVWAHLRLTLSSTLTPPPGGCQATKAPGAPGPASGSLSGGAV